MRWGSPKTGLLLAGLLGLGACEYQDLINVDPESIEIVLSPRTATLEALGDTVRISAEVSVDGVPVPSAPLTWRSLNPGVATVDRNGKVEAVRPGTAAIEVSVSSRSATATIIVEQKVASLVVMPVGGQPGGGPPPDGAMPTINGIGDSLRFVAVARDRNGNEVADPKVEWSSLDPSVAVVSEDGVVRGVGYGIARINARAGGVSQTVSVLVQATAASVEIEPERGTLTAFGDTLRLRAVARDEGGNVIGEAGIAWTSLSPGVASVDDRGLVTARGNGEALIVASAAGVADTALVAVEQRPAAVTITPNAFTIAVGSTTQLAATAADANGHAIEKTSFTWSSSNPGVASVDGSGRVRGVSVGTATITARAGNRTASATVTVSSTPVGSVSVSPAEASVQAGSAVQLTAQVKDPAGNILKDRPVTWSSSDTTVATVSVSGLVRGIKAGAATITAASGGKSGSAQVMVTAAPSSQVARVEITPAADTLDALGAKTQFTARAYGGDGGLLSGARITWISLHPNIATVDSMGIVTARAVGAALIVAAAPCCGKADTARVLVRQVAASVEVSPTSRGIEVGASYRLEATAKDANGHVVPDAKFSWTSSNSSVAVVDQTGLVTGIAIGSATITVTSSGKTASAQINVTGGGNGGNGGSGSASLVGECSRPQPAWIWCDDFDQDRLGQYFEYDNRGGRFVRATGVGVGGSGAMRARFNAGDVNAGSLKLAFGRTPGSYFRPVDSGSANYREVYWRFYLRNAPGWTGGGGDKLARAVIFAGSNWSEALIAHVWSGGSGGNYLVLDPASGTDAQGNVRTTKYNDFANLRWLGAQVGKTPIFDAAHVGQWYCIETRVRVNDPGQSNGVFELWINGNLEARATNLNWVGSYSAYGINALLLENYWNNGSPRQQERYIDNLVVSTQRIGCGESPGGGNNDGGSVAPAPVATVTVSPSSGTIQVNGTLQLTATPRDQNGNALSGRTITWSSSNTSVATVTSSGLVRGIAPGTATITATSEGRTGQATVTVTQQQGGVSAQPWVFEDFSTYTSTQHMLSDPRGIYGTRLWGDKGQQHITLDMSTGYGSSNRSMKYTFPNRTNSSSRCQDFSIGRDLLLPTYTPNRRSGNEPRELWIEVVAKFSQNFKTRAPASWNCTSAPDYKWIFGLIYQGGRFELKIGQQGSRLTIGGPPGNTIEDVIPGLRAEDYWDGQWHVYRLHFKFPSSADAADGALEAWVDGRKVYSRTGLRADPKYANDAFYGVALGANLNQGPAEEMSLWWGRVSVWRENPGW